MTRALDLRMVDCVGSNPIDGGRIVWERRIGEKPAGNGSLMRTAPIGVYFAANDELSIDSSWTDSSLTHYDPRCVFACVAFNGAVAAGVRGASTAEMLTSAARDLELARRRYDAPGYRYRMCSAQERARLPKISASRTRPIPVSTTPPRMTSWTSSLKPGSFASRFVSRSGS